MTPTDRPDKRWFHKHPVPTLAAAVVLGCVVVVFAAELAARVFLPEWPPRGAERIKFWTYDEKLGWAHEPGACGRFAHRDFSVEVRINNRCMRDDDYPVARNAKKRMLVLGDSFGWGFGVDQNRRFSELLEALHPQWEIINASVSGYGTDQQLILLEEIGAEFRPDVVLLLFHHSDFRNNLSATEYWYNKPYFTQTDGGLQLNNTPVPTPSTRQKIERFLLGRTYVGKLMYNRSGRLRRALADSTSWGEEAELPAGRMRILKAGCEITRALVKAIDETCRSRGSRFVLVSIPMSEAERGCLSELAAEDEIPYLPLDAFFESSAEVLTFPHDGHWNEAGHRTAAAAVETFLVGLSIF